MKLEKNRNHTNYDTKKLHICHSEESTRAIVFRCLARLEICLHRRELQFQFPVAVVERKPFNCHPLRQNVLFDQRLLIEPNRQYGGLFITKRFLADRLGDLLLYVPHAFWASKFLPFPWLYFLSPRPVPFKNASGAALSLQQYTQFNKVSQKPSCPLSSSTRNRISTLSKAG